MDVISLGFWFEPHAITLSTMPAAMVSPPRLTKILPMSLLTENGSNGIGRAVADGADNVPARNVISTSAEVPRDKTRGFLFTTEPDARSVVATNLESVAGTSRE